jgi:hypothetical protein
MEVSATVGRVPTGSMRDELRATPEIAHRAIVFHRFETMSRVDRTSPEKWMRLTLADATMSAKTM